MIASTPPLVPAATPDGQTDAQGRRARYLLDRDGEVAWEARQQAIGECIVDLSAALGSGSTSWQQLLELARLHCEIVGAARIARIARGSEASS